MINSMITEYFIFLNKMTNLNGLQNKCYDVVNLPLVQIE